MKKFINKLLIKRDEVAIDKLIAEYQQYFENNDANIYSEEVRSVFERINKYYKKYSLSFSIDIHNKNYDAAITKFAPFLLSSLSCAFIFQKIGAYEGQKEIIDFFMASISDEKLIVPLKVVQIFENMRIENLLRLSIIQKDEGKNDSLVQSQLDAVHDYHYAHISSSKPATIGELALYHFTAGNKPRALDYLEMQYSNYSKDINKTLVSEITENKAFFNRSSTGAKYKDFVQDFINTKEPAKKLKLV